MLKANPNDLKEQAKLQKFEALLNSEDNSSEETEFTKAKTEQTETPSETPENTSEKKTE